MTEYLLSAAGVIFLSVIISLIIPEGKLNKSITFIMRLICSLVLIQPITGIFKIGGESAAGGSLADYTYVSSIYSEHQSEQLEILIDKEFEATTDCKVTVNYADGNFKVSEIEVQLQENNPKLIKQIYAYLDGLGYINITVYAKST